MPRPTKRKLLWLALACAALLAPALAGEASACPVCYGGAEGDVIEGAKLSVMFMGVLVYAVMGGGVAMVVVARRRKGPGGQGDPEVEAAKGNEPSAPERPER